MSKCPKCNNSEFSIDTKTYSSIAFVKCTECESVVGVLENIDFNTKFNLITNNQTGLERLINIRTDEIKSEIRKELNEQNDKIDYILGVIEKLNKNL